MVSAAYSIQLFVNEQPERVEYVPVGEDFFPGGQLFEYKKTGTYPKWRAVRRYNSKMRQGIIIPAALAFIWSIGCLLYLLKTMYLHAPQIPV